MVTEMLNEMLNTLIFINYFQSQLLKESTQGTLYISCLNKKEVSLGRP